jgi:hypothetical protein
VELLLKRGANANITNNVRGSRIMRCAALCCAVLRCAALRCADASSVLPQDGDTPMHLAARDGKQEAVQLLVKHGADTSIKNKVRRAASLLGPR